MTEFYFLVNPTPRTTLSIRELLPADPPTIAAAFSAQGWNKPESQYWHYLEEQDSGLRLVLLAEVGLAPTAQFAGYLTVVWDSGYPPFHEAKIPEIVDFNVLIRFQRQGIGSALMDEAERRIAERSSLAGIGVGLTSDYGAAHILYIKRGYIPDGRGLFSIGRWLKYGDFTVVNDELTIQLTKDLTRGSHK
jgi:ribosomal protein S18 acetylase RimI-like enzyme